MFHAPGHLGRALFRVCFPGPTARPQPLLRDLFRLIESDGGGILLTQHVISPFYVTFYTYAG
jgi:hypothetical protein